MGRSNFPKTAANCISGLPPPVLQDTTLLEEEIVNIEAVLHGSPIVYPGRNRKGTKALLYLCIPFGYRKGYALGSKELPEVQVGHEGNQDRPSIQPQALLPRNVYVRMQDVYRRPRYRTRQL